MGALNSKNADSWMTPGVPAGDMQILDLLTGKTSSQKARFSASHILYSQASISMRSTLTSSDHSLPMSLATFQQPIFFFFCK